MHSFDWFQDLVVYYTSIYYPFAAILIDYYALSFIVYFNMTHLILFLTVKYSIARIIRTPKADVQKNVERNKSNKGST